MFAWIFTRDGSDFPREQIHDRAILVRRPDRAIEPEKACACAFFATETERAVEQSRSEPFEADRRFAQAAAPLVYDPINHAAAHQGFANRYRRRPLWAMRQ